MVDIRSAEHRRSVLVSEPDLDALSEYLTTQCERILRGEIELAEETTPETVHRMRVAVRRLRSTVRVFAPLLEPDAEVLQSFDDDLRWLAGLLSGLRDADVLDRQVRAAVDDLPTELVIGPVREELDIGLADRRSTALRRWQEPRDEQRYAATLDAVRSWLAHPPVQEGLSDEDIRRRGKKLLRAARRKAAKRLRNAGDDPVAVHRARKATKRLRYTADALRPALPRAKKAGKRAKKLHGVLGDHQDLVVRTGFLRDQAARFGGQEGHNGFTYGLLRGRAESQIACIRGQVPRKS